uniref:WWE domain-containing protein n=1 Tax=Eutreptiella gymnastica TaxID=73025 RepID=A0A7S1NRN6_9EUGL|mmetsp:Transcript_71479/g.125767  ORF Transcript_71479/g.125767 Transcript_71479/m.125767 type:complete len:402 (+) Transcript_71479:47-1252(+)
MMDGPPAAFPYDTISTTVLGVPHRDPSPANIPRPPAVEKATVAVVWPTPEWAYFSTTACNWVPFMPEHQSSLENDRRMGAAKRIIVIDGLPCTASATEKLLNHSTEGTLPMRRLDHSRPGGPSKGAPPRQSVAWATLNPLANTWEFFPERISQAIEACLSKGNRQVTVAVQQGPWFTIVFESMLQVDDEGHFRHVRRMHTRPKWDCFDPREEKWGEFPARESELLERYCRGGVGSVNVIVGGKKVIFDFDHMRCRTQTGEWVALHQDICSMQEGAAPLTMPNALEVQRYISQLLETKRTAGPDIVAWETDGPPFCVPLPEPQPQAQPVAPKPNLNDRRALWSPRGGGRSTWSTHARPPPRSHSAEARQPLNDDFNEVIYSRDSRASTTVGGDQPSPPDEAL